MGGEGNSFYVGPLACRFSKSLTPISSTFQLRAVYGTGQSEMEDGFYDRPINDWECYNVGTTIDTVFLS